MLITWLFAGAVGIVETIILCLIGLFAGALGGLLGIGGSIIMIPAMTEFFGPRQHLYQAAAMIVNFFVVVPAVIQHLRAGAVMGRMVRLMAPLAVGGVICGVLASEWSVFHGRGQAYLIILFLLYAAAQNVPQLISRRTSSKPEGSSDPPPHGWRVALGAGVPTGLVAGLLGVGGGIVCVPLQNRLLGIPLRNAIANSAATIIALSCIGAVSKNYALVIHHPEYTVGESLRLAAALIPTAIVGALIGARLTHRLPLRILRAALIVLLVAASARMINRGAGVLSDTPPPPANSAAMTVGEKVAFLESGGDAALGCDAAA